MTEPTTACGPHGVEIREGWFVSVCQSCGTRVDLAVALGQSIEATRAEAAADALRAARARVAALVSPGMVKSQLEGNPNACGYVEAINRVLAALEVPA